MGFSDAVSLVLVPNIEMKSKIGDIDWNGIKE